MANDMKSTIAQPKHKELFIDLKIKHSKRLVYPYDII